MRTTMLLMVLLLLSTPSGALAGTLKPVRIATRETVLMIGSQNNLPAFLQLTAPPLTGNVSSANWLAHSSPVALINHVFADDRSQALHWKLRQEKPAGRKSGLTLTLESDPPLLEARLRWIARSGPGPVEFSLSYINRSTATLRLPFSSSLRLTLAAPGKHTLENWWVEKGAGMPTAAGTHHDRITADYAITLHSTSYTPDDRRDMIPWMCVQDVTADRGFYFGIVSSGRVQWTLQAKEQGRHLEVTAGLDPTGGDFHTTLKPGEIFALPSVLIGSYNGSVDEGANHLHRYIEAHLRPAAADQRYPLLVNNSWGSGMAVSDTLCRKMIDNSVDLGLEMFHVDAGWFNSVGDWHSDRAKLPSGLEAIADYAHQRGLLFGLWVGWTQGGIHDRGPETLSVHNPQQQRWFTRDYPPDWKPSDFVGADVCLASRLAQEWCLAELRRIVTTYKLDLLEHDQRMVVEQCVQTDHGHSAHPADIAARAAEGYNRIYDQLRKEHPRLLFEDCVNGGRMVDFSVIQRVHYISITDTYDPLSNRRAFYDSSYPLPPAMCECYIANDPGPTLATFIAMLRSGMMGWCTVMCDTEAWNASQRQAAKRQFVIYKRWLRPLIRSGALYHITPRPDGVHWDGIYDSPKTGRGVVYAFRGTTEETTHRFHPRGLDKNRSYRVWLEDTPAKETVLSGEALMTEGVKVTLSEKGSSELIYLQKAL